MKYCDSNPNILYWSNEEVIIPYYNPLDQKYHRYFVDFYIEMVDKSGNIKHKLIEVKPEKQTKEPVKKSKITPRYLNEVQTWIINKNKWEAAEQYCKTKNWDFLILTEKNLFK